HHDIERRVVAAMARAHEHKLVVGLEMLTWNLQGPLDQFNQGAIDVDAMASSVDWQKAWGFSFDMYRPIFVDGHKDGARFLALNAPRELVRAVRRKGVFGLTAPEKKALPELDLGDDQHRAWFKGIFSGDGHPANDSDIDSFYTAQVVWDEAMAQTASKALDDGAAQVIVIAGVGHIARGRGVPERIERREPSVHVLTIVPLTGVSSDNASDKLKEAVVDGEGDIIVIPRFAEEISL
ncbi:MAG TPA: ChaN family lipoprotein, partial [Myxococcota bacterium]